MASSTGNYANRVAFYISSFVVLVGCVQTVQASSFPAHLKPSNSESRSLTDYVLSSSHSNNINHQQQQHPLDIDAPKYYKLNELLYKSRPRTSSIGDEEEAAGVASQARSRDQTIELRPLGVGASQAANGAPPARRRVNGYEDDESSIDSLIRDMQDGDRTGVTYAKGPSSMRRIDATGGGKMDSSIGGGGAAAYDEASIQRKSTNSIDEDLSGLDEASARLKRQGKF